MTTNYHFDIDLPGETWRAIQGKEGYFVSDLGRVASARRIGPRVQIDLDAVRLLTLRPAYGSYLHFRTYDGRAHTVHRRVADAFLEPVPSPKHEVAFGDGDVTNCRLDNLSWKTRHQKHTDGEVRPIPLRPYRAKLVDSDVVTIRRGLERGIAKAALARQFDITPATIWAIQHGRTWKHVA